MTATDPQPTSRDAHRVLGARVVHYTTGISVIGILAEAQSPLNPDLRVLLLSNPHEILVTPGQDGTASVSLSALGTMLDTMPSLRVRDTVLHSTQFFGIVEPDARLFSAYVQVLEKINKQEQTGA